MKSKATNKITALFVSISMALAFMQAAFAAPGGDGPGGTPPGGSDSSSVTYNAATTISSDTTAIGTEYTSETAGQNALLVTGGTSTLTDITVTKSGSPSGSSDNYDFYGTNAAVCVTDGTLNIEGDSAVTTNGSYANGIYAHGDGVINVTGATVTTTANNSGGVMVTGGGTLTANNVTVNTAGGSSAAIRSDRGGGTLTVNGGSYTTTGQGSPAIYSTADVTVGDAELTAEHSEGVVVEGSNSVTLDTVTLTDTNDTLNGQSTTYKNVFLYQSQSGDAAVGTGYFTAKDSTITTNKGDTFFVTNNTAVITLENNEFINNDSTGYFLRAMTGAWGTSGSNGGAVTLTATEQDIEGDIYIDSISSLSMTLANGSSFEGAVTGNGTSTDVALTLDSTSTWTLTGDSYIKSLSNTGVTNNSNINLNGHTLYVNGTQITSTDYSDSGDGNTDTSDDFAVTINSVDTTDNILNSANVTVTGTGTAMLYAAVYEGSTLISVDSTEVTETNSALSFDDAMSYNAKTQTLKLFAWNGIEPVSDVYEIEASQVSPAATAAPYTATFEVDDGVSSIDIYYTQDSTTADETNVKTAYARDGSTGEILTDGSGQINFVVNVAEGYRIASVTATEGTYKNLKTPTNTGVENGYRLTKVNADTTITITTEEIPEETGDGIIHLNGTSIDATGVDGATVSGTTLSLAASDEAYKIEGTLEDGNVVVAKNAGDVTLEFVDDVSVTSSTAAAISAKSGADITLTAADGVTASFSSSAKKAIDASGDIIINGDGEIEAVTTSQKNAIGGENVTISGNSTVTVNSQKHGIEGAESVTISDSPTVNVTSLGDGIRSDSAPAVATDGTVAASTTVTGGTVTINGGTINITSTSYIEETTDTETNITTTETKTGDGIQADTLLAINGGTITIDAAGETVKAGFSQLDVSDATDYSTYTSKLSEYNGCVVITGGTLNAAADEDGIKAAKDVTISGGNVTVTEAGDDGIQAGDVVSNVSGSTVTFGKIDGTVTVSGSNTVVDIKKAAGDGIAATYKYNQTAGKVDITSTNDGIQAGKAYSSYEIMETSGYDDDTNIYETNGIVDISGGTLDIYTYKGGTTSPGSSTLDSLDSCKGIKARKLIDISGGTINIASEDDCIHSDHTVNISDGSITAKSSDDGVHGEYYLNISGGTIDVTQSYEGIEASKIYLTGGETYVVSSDDGANGAGDDPSTLSSEKTAYTLTTVTGYEPSSTATLKTASSSSSSGSSSGSQRPGQGGPNMGQEDTSSYGYIEVSDGLLFIQAEGDGFDSNGSALISGGMVLVNGPTSGGNGVFDTGDSNSDTIVITGGTVIGAGTSDMAVTPTSSTGSQAYVVTTLSSNQNAGKGIQVTNGSNEIITYIPSKAYKWILVSTPSISSGTSYTVKYGGNVSGGTWAENYNETYGIKTGATFSGGSSSSVTAVTGGSSSQGGSQPGRP